MSAFIVSLEQIRGFEKEWEMLNTQNPPYLPFNGLALPGKCLGSDGTQAVWMDAPQVRSKCPSCGSREFVAHHGQMVCSYCRSSA